MASLMENLIAVLSQECDTYEGLLELSRQKTRIIVKNDLDGLTKITEQEQEQASVIANLEKNRRTVTADIANVLNKDVASVTLSYLIGMLSNRPGEQKALSEVRDRLKDLTTQLNQINQQNSELIQNALEMIQFEMNLMHAMQTAPETANYSKGAYNTGDMMGVTRGGFDAKQ